MKALNEKLILVRLAIHQWYPRKFDKKATAQIANLHGVDPDRAGRFNKILVDLESIKPLQKAMRKLRDTHDSMTAPWADKGVRVLPAELYFDYVKMFSKAKAEIDNLADQYAIQYQSERDRARQELNGLFSETDYPASHELRARFGVDYKLSPIPNADDVRIWGIGDQAADEIASEVRASIEASVKDSQASVVDSVTTRAQEFIDKVRAYENNPKGKLYDTAVSNLSDIVGTVLKGLNLTGDQELDKLATELQAAIKGVNSEQLKHSSSECQKKTREVEAVLSKFKGVF